MYIQGRLRVFQVALLLSAWCTPCISIPPDVSLPFTENFDPATADPLENITCEGTIPNFLHEVHLTQLEL